MDGTRVRLKTQAWPEPTPVKRCRACHQVLPLSSFAKRANGAQGVTALCKACIAHRYEAETFGCNRCSRRLPGPEFPRGSAGAAIEQPCKRCRSSIKASATRNRRIVQGRAPYHLLSGIDEQQRTATCRECGPTHIYSTGTSKGRGWRCGSRADEISAAWYDAKAKVIDKHAASRWHRVRNVRGTEMRGTCSLCGDVPVRWSQSDGRFVCASSTRKRQHADRERRRRRLAVYGLSVDDYERMAQAQGQRCAICGGSRSRMDSDGALVVDHNHVTGRIRGLLCTLCNTGLGAMRDDPAILLAAIRYLRAFEQPDAADAGSGDDVGARVRSPERRLPGVVA
jgi:Recombination endonuclease VII